MLDLSSSSFITMGLCCSQKPRDTGRQESSTDRQTGNNSMTSDNGFLRSTIREEDSRLSSGLREHSSNIRSGLYDHYRPTSDISDEETVQGVNKKILMTDIIAKKRKSIPRK